MNRYEQKQEDRRARLERLAAKCQAGSDSAYKRARQMASIIPLGQPILVGHYSEKGDRAYRAKIWRMQDRCCELAAKAKYFAERAAAVGSGGISSDDPQATEKLRLKVVKLEHLQEVMRKANKLIRSKKLTGPQKIEELCFLGIPERAAGKLLLPDFCGRIGFADYQLSNNNANIRRIRERIGSLQAAPEQVRPEREVKGITVKEDAGENRLMLLFPGKPEDPIRRSLKAAGFRWSPTNGAWQRQLNNAARAAADYVLSQEHVKAA
jgi:hypothetical protein